MSITWGRESAARLGMSRREFLGFCTAMAASMGLSAVAGEAMAEAILAPRRPAVIWLALQECTGCTESMLRAEHPTLEKLILEIISLDYNEALMAGAGHQAEAARRASMAANHGKYVLVLEGAIPEKDGGIYCKIGGQTAKAMVLEAAAGAAAVIAIGSCASWGGMPSTPPNPTGCVGAPSIIKDKPVVTIPGCPPNPYNFLSTVVHFLTFGKLPELDHLGRPKFAYSRLIHENCERRAHFDNGRFAMEFGDAGHRAGYCLYRLGCKGPETYANCPSILFGDVGSGSWPVGTGHPCIGCTEQHVGFEKPIHALAALAGQTPPATYPRIVEEQGQGATLASAGVLVAVAAAAAGGGGMVMHNIGKREAESERDTRREEGK
ncbi:MAG: hydrogenase small subunit [Magnetococcales bacterium]|nr:hydrogenase small subunit [Magnetococcales bacterium]